MTRIPVIPDFDYAEGVPSLSPGLARGTSAYPGYHKTRPTLKGLHPGPNRNLGTRVNNPGFLQGNRRRFRKIINNYQHPADEFRT
jgi:hypothetical protein